MASQEWYTNQTQIGHALTFFDGKIHLDPASNPQRTVPALYHYTEEHNGLGRPWGKFIETKGRWQWPFTVFVNPPWKDILIWVRKAISEYEQGHCSDVLFLLPNRTETKFFQELSPYPTCLIDSRVNYCEPGPDGQIRIKQGIREGSCWVYIGSRQYQRFIQYFSEHQGRVMLCVAYNKK